MPRVGELFAGRYSVERMVGRGGMGVVYVATQAPLGRRVAVKVLKPPETVEDDPNFEHRFLREAAAAAKLQHPNTITIFDFGQAPDGALFIVMEYLEGADLRTVLAHDGPMPAARALHIARQVVKSLREAHQKGMIHRDLKPANVLLVQRDDDPDFVKVVDFGLVKFRGEASEITLAGKFLGSPRYTAPEALDRNRDVDHRADIYAVGILVYAMITGAPPFDGDPLQILHAHLHEKPKPLYRANPAAQTSPDLEALVQRCLEKDPDRRFQTMADLLIALRKCGAAFGQEDTETVDLDDAESLDFDVEPSQPPDPPPPVEPTGVRPSPAPPEPAQRPDGRGKDGRPKDSRRKARPERRLTEPTARTIARRKQQGNRKVIAGIAALAVVLAAAAALLLRGGGELDADIVEPSGPTAPSPPTGEAPVIPPSGSTSTAVAPVGGDVPAATATLPTATAPSDPTPAASPTRAPDPLRDENTPSPAIRAKAKPKPDPSPADPTPEEVPSGYKENPY